MKKYVFYTVFLILSLYFLVNTTRTLFHLYQVEQKVGDSKRQLQEIENENKKLKSKFDEVNSHYFLEKEARNKLLMKKDGEDVFVIENPDLRDKQEKQKENLPNWKKWYNLFFG